MRIRISAADRRAFKRVASLGGRARALALTPERRREIAQHAIRTRWTRVKAYKAKEVTCVGKEDNNEQ